MTDDELRRLREDAESDENEEFGSETVLALLNRVAKAEAAVRNLTGERDRARAALRQTSVNSSLRRAENAALRQWKAEALPVMAGLQALGKALGLPLGVSITGEQAAERAAALRATMERVRGELTEPHAFAPSSDAWELGYARGYNNAREAIRLRAALDGDS